MIVFYQLFGLSRHPFTAEDPLVSKWYNGTFLHICSDKETNTLAGLWHMDGLWVSKIIFGGNYSVVVLNWLVTWPTADCRYVRTRSSRLFSVTVSICLAVLPHYWHCEKHQAAFFCFLCTHISSVGQLGKFQLDAFLLSVPPVGFVTE